jgi:lipopolysaccharide/colanic/teichoic acid biosynthesis glycosyltransferase
MVAQNLSRTPSAPVVEIAVPTELTPHKFGGAKRVVDLVVGLLVLVAVAPLIVAAWVLVRLTSAGPGFYSQVRVGRHGRPYRIYKIRSMCTDSERTTGATWCVKNDPRVTPVGRVIRKLHIDELPQVWNVLKGDMSLVGPRPERPEFVGPLSQEVHGYSERHRVRPGVTGLAQIQLPPDTSVDSVRRKTVLDRCYIDRCTHWLDLRIMLGTLLYLTGCSYATVRRVMRLPNPLVDSLPACPQVTDDTQEMVPLTSAEPISWVEAK